MEALLPAAPRPEPDPIPPTSRFANLVAKPVPDPGETVTPTESATRVLERRMNLAGE